MRREHDPQWTVRGVVEQPDVGGAGDPLCVSIIDLDPIEHDLIARGWTDADGRFEFTFGTEDFNLQPLERERWPDIWIVVHRDPANPDSALYSRGQPRCAWEHRELEVTIGQDELDDGTEAREVPEHSDRRVTRTRLTESLLNELPDRVAPDVTSATGLDQIDRPTKVEVGLIQNRTVDHLLARVGDWSTRLCSMVSFHELESIAYDPIDDTIVVHPECRTMSTAALEVLFARAMVARLQFQRTPELLDQLVEAGHSAWVALRALDDRSCGSRSTAGERRRFEHAAVELLATSDLAQFAAALDAQVARIDQQLRVRHRSIDVPDLEPSIATRLLQAVALRFDIGHQQVDLVVRTLREESGTGGSRTHTPGVLPS